MTASNALAVGLLVGYWAGVAVAYAILRCTRDAGPSDDELMRFRIWLDNQLERRVARDAARGLTPNVDLYIGRATGWAVQFLVDRFRDGRPLPQRED